MLLQRSSHNEYSMHGIESKDHRIEIYEIYKISLFRFDDKIYIQNNEFDRIN